MDERRAEIVGVSFLIFDPQDAATVYAVTFGGGVFAMSFLPEP